MHAKPGQMVFAAIVLFIFAALLPQHYSAARDTGRSGVNATLAERFSASDENSDITLDYSPLTKVLEDSVFPMARATKRLGWKNKQTKGIGTNISISVNSSPSRYEGNRIMIHAFSHDHTKFFKDFQKGLENISNSIPLAFMKKDEQLAFWLNLYNVIVMNKIIAEYPISTTKHFGSIKTPFGRKKALKSRGSSCRSRTLKIS